MAINKNITMKQYNGTDYDTLYPKTIAEQVDGVYSKEQVASAATKALYNLTADKVPNDVFVKINELISANTEAIANGVQIETGSYTGTGDYGADNPNTLTFGFVPKIVFLNIQETSRYNSIPEYYIMFYGCEGLTAYFASEAMKVLWNGNTVSWWTTSSSSEGEKRQMNISGKVYKYMVIG